MPSKTPLLNPSEYDGSEAEINNKLFDIIFNVFRNVIDEIESLFRDKRYSVLTNYQKVAWFKSDLQKYLSTDSNTFDLLVTRGNDEFLICQVVFLIVSQTEGSKEYWEILIEDKFRKVQSFDSERFVRLRDELFVMSKEKGVKILEKNPIFNYEIINKKSS